MTLQPEYYEGGRRQGVDPLSQHYVSQHTHRHIGKVCTSVCTSVTTLGVAHPDNVHTI